MLPNDAPLGSLDGYHRGVALTNYFWVKIAKINLELFWRASNIHKGSSILKWPPSHFL